jgi:hypothetical protein
MQAKMMRLVGTLVLAVMLGLAAAPAFADQEAEAEESGDGGDASNPTAAVNFQDFRYRYFDLSRGVNHSFETVGSYVFSPSFKVTNELRGVHTDRTGDWETDFQEFKVKGIYLSPFRAFGIKARLALGLEWAKDLGEVKDGTGTGSDVLAPLVGAGWLLSEKDFVITLVQYFHSYTEDTGVDKVRQTGPRLIYIRKIPEITGWVKGDWKGAIDHEQGEEFSSTVEFQLGKMLGPRWGLYDDTLVGLDSDAFDWGVGAGVRFMY